MNVIVGLLPALVLLGGALLSILPLPLSFRFRRWIPLAACVVAGFALIYVSRAAEPVTLFPPVDALPALSLTLQWNGAALPLGLFLLVVLCGRLLFGIERHARVFVFGSLIAASGALLFFAADNFTMLASAWVLVELGLLSVPAQEGDTSRAAAHAFGWNLVAIVLLLTAGMVVSNQASSLRLAEVQLEGVSAFLFLLAAWIRSGVYPLHVAAPANLNSLGVRVGLPMLLGGYLVTRFISQVQGGIAFDAELKILTVLAVGASALVVVGQLHGGEALTWVLRAFGTLLFVLPLFVNPPLAAALGAWFAPGAFAVCVFIEIASQWRAELPQIRLALMVWIAGLIVVASLPLAPTFWTRVGALDAAYSQTGIALWLLLVAALSLTLVPVWREIFASSQVAPKVPSLFEYAALACVILPSLALTFAPAVFLAPFGSNVQAGGALAFRALFQPTNFTALIFLLAGLAVPLLASFELARRWEPRANLLPTTVTNIFDLSDLSMALDAFYHFARLLLQQALSLLEQPPIAWLIFLVIWVAVWVIGLSS